jgi:ribosomal protein L7/L12
MIKVEMTVREALNMVANGCNLDIFEKIVLALETAIGDPKMSAKMKVVADCVRADGSPWDHKISAIKALRHATGMGLKEAKDWVEFCQYGNGTSYSPALAPDVAEKLCNELKQCEVHCWVAIA